MMCVLHVRQKGTSPDKVTSNSEEIKPIALSIVDLLEASVSHHKILLNRKFHRNLLERFRVTPAGDIYELSYA